MLKELGLLGLISTIAEPCNGMIDLAVPECFLEAGSGLLCTSKCEKTASSFILSLHMGHAIKPSSGLEVSSTHA